MGFNELIEIKKSRVSPKPGDVFVVQPRESIYYYGKVIKTELKSTDSFINGMYLIYVYDKMSEEIVAPQTLHLNRLLIPPVIVNKQPWIKGYFYTICNEKITDEEQNINYGFWNIISKRFVDLNGKALEQEPGYWSYYGLGSYGVVGKDIQKALNK